LVGRKLLLKHGKEVIVSNLGKVLVVPEIIHLRECGGVHEECRG
jgi:hypothetical protein